MNQRTARYFIPWRGEIHQLHDFAVPTGMWASTWSAVNLGAVQDSSGGHQGRPRPLGPAHHTLPSTSSLNVRGMWDPLDLSRPDEITEGEAASSGPCTGRLDVQGPRSVLGPRGRHYRVTDGTPAGAAFSAWRMRPRGSRHHFHGWMLSLREKRGPEEGFLDKVNRGPQQLCPVLTSKGGRLWHCDLPEPGIIDHLVKSGADRPWGTRVCSY